MRINSNQLRLTSRLTSFYKSLQMQAIADIWTVLVGKKIRPHQVALMYAAAKIVRANNEYKYDSYIDAINYLVQADEIHREDVSSLVDSYFPTTTKEDVSI